MRMNSDVFVDTSGWCDPVLNNVQTGQQMQQYMRQLVAGKRRMVTTNYIITEVVALLDARAHTMSRPDLVRYVNRIKGYSQLEIVHIDEATDQEAWKMLEQYDDKQWSLVDAASFVIMRRFGISEVFTSDHHFAQAGFIRVPLVP